MHSHHLHFPIVVYSHGSDSCHIGGDSCHIGSDSCHIGRDLGSGKLQH